MDEMPEPHSKDLILRALSWVGDNAPKASASAMNFSVSNPVTTGLLIVHDRLTAVIESLMFTPFTEAGRRSEDFYQEICYSHEVDPTESRKDLVLHFEPEDNEVFRRQVKILLGRRLRYDSKYEIPGKLFMDYPEAYFEAFGPKFS